MNLVDIIARKRDGGELTETQIAAVIQGFAQGAVPDYQMSSLAMAIYLRGMSAVETQWLTEQMLRSGATLSWPAGGLPKVDKHSTGGTGDKVSLVLAPLLACCDLKVPMLSGRGLGPTGGTLDKLEAIPGFRTNLTRDEIGEIADRVGCVITGTTSDLAPADRKLYALRDVTGTVASIPLITASIMSKKLAENLDALVLDVKFGSGAFMKSQDDARRLARSMVETGKRMNVKTTALLTDMNQPLGRLAGNAVEISETLDTLRGCGPADLWEVTEALGAELLLATGRATSITEAGATLRKCIASGQALKKFREMVTAQGGDLDAVRPVGPASEIRAKRAGFVQRINVEQLGLTIIELGGGRKQLTDTIDHSSGLEMLVRIGDHVAADQPLVRVFAPLAQKLTSTQLGMAQAVVEGAIEIGDEPCEPLPLIVERIT